jgi:hypothetical protein
VFVVTSSTVASSHLFCDLGQFSSVGMFASSASGFRRVCVLQRVLLSHVCVVALCTFRNAALLDGSVFSCGCFFYSYLDCLISTKPEKALMYHGTDEICWCAVRGPRPVPIRRRHQHYMPTRRPAALAVAAHNFHGPFLGSCDRSATFLCVFFYFDLSVKLFFINGS